MKRLLLILPFFCAMAAIRADAAPPQHAQPQLIANVKTVARGDFFVLGVLIHIDPHWHVYWQYPGESGEATLVKWEVPPGFIISATQYPIPNRLVMPGGIINFGYEDEVLLIAHVASINADRMAKGDCKFAATVSWLACNADACIPGNQHMELTLAVADETQPDNGPIFDRWMPRLPARPEDGIHVDTTAPDARAKITWPQPPKNVEYFPDVPEVVELKDLKVSTDGNTTTIQFQAQPLARQQMPAELYGVITYQDANGQRRGFNVNILLKKKP